MIKRGWILGVLLAGCSSSPSPEHAGAPVDAGKDVGTPDVGSHDVGGEVLQDGTPEASGEAGQDVWTWQDADASEGNVVAEAGEDAAEEIEIESGVDAKIDPPIDATISYEPCEPPSPNVINCNPACGDLSSWNDGGWFCASGGDCLEPNILLIPTVPDLSIELPAVAGTWPSSCYLLTSCGGSVQANFTVMAQTGCVTVTSSGQRYLMFDGDPMPCPPKFGAFTLTADAGKTIRVMSISGSPPVWLRVQWSQNPCP